MFCVDMAPCWRRPCHVLAWGGIVPARGVVRTLLATGTDFLESTAGMFLRLRSDIEYRFCTLVLNWVCFGFEATFFIIIVKTINESPSHLGKY